MAGQIAPDRQQHLVVGPCQQEAEPAIAYARAGAVRVVGLLHHHAVVAAVKHQRRPFKAVEVHDFAHEDDVVTAFVPVHHAAFKPGRAAIEQRYVAMATPDLASGKLVCPAPGELVGDLLLVSGQDMHREMPGGLESRQAGRLLAQAP
ncbi:hypothetical protein D9M68_464480 [compost metagenome]